MSIQTQNITAKPLSLAVHVHLYYLQMWPVLKRYLQNIGDYPYDLYITLVDDDPALIEDIKAFHKQATVWVIENRGYDVGPFIYFLHQIDLRQYDLVLKIHSKTPQGRCLAHFGRYFLDRHRWTDMLLQGLLESNNLFCKIMEAFQSDTKLGLVGSKYCQTSQAHNFADVKEQLSDIMQKLGVSMPPKTTFIAGTMFMMRGALLQVIKDNFRFEDFEFTDGTIKDGTLAHVMERLFGILTVTQGYKIESFNRNLYFEFYNIFLWLGYHLYSKKITNKGYLLIKICKIPVWHQKVR